MFTPLRRIAADTTSHKTNLSGMHIPRRKTGFFEPDDIHTFMQTFALTLFNHF